MVHGWLNAKGETFENRLRFYSHSVVRDPTGALLDVTLNASDPNYAFVLHPFDDAHFREQVSGRIAMVDHMLGPDPEISLDLAVEDPKLDNRQF